MTNRATPHRSRHDEFEVAIVLAAINTSRRLTEAHSGARGPRLASGPGFVQRQDGVAGVGTAT